MHSQQVAEESAGAERRQLVRVAMQHLQMKRQRHLTVSTGEVLNPLTRSVSGREDGCSFFCSGVWG